MDSWVIDSSAARNLALRTTPDPRPLAHEALIRVEAFAPSPGDLAALGAAEPGFIPGWDGAGTVVQAAADGSGPREGQGVLFLGMAGGWAQLRSVPTATIGVTPFGAEPEAMSAIPVPVTSALRSLRKLGSLLGKRLLVVGGSSAVGSAVVQLATQSGAEVVAVARTGATHDGIRALGAREVHSSVEEVTGRVDAAIDLVGGQHLVAAYALLRSGGTVIALGHSAGEDEVFPYGAFIADPENHARSITTFFLGTEPDLAPDLAFLAAEVHAGRLSVGPLDSRPWTDLGAWVADGGPRRNGRVVFRVE